MDAEQDGNNISRSLEDDGFSSLPDGDDAAHMMERRIGAALRRVYDDLYELNYNSDTYRLIHHKSGKFAMPPLEGSISIEAQAAAVALVHPEDRPAFLRLLDLHKESYAVGGGRQDEMRMLWLDGQYRWASLGLFPIADSPDDQIYLLGVLDIDVRKNAEEMARKNHMLEEQRLADERYRIIIELTDTLVFEWNWEANSRYLAPDIEKRFAGNYDKRDPLRIWMEDNVIHPDDRAEFKACQTQLATIHHGECTVRFLRRDETYIWCRLGLACLVNAQGQPQRYIGTIKDMDEAQRSMLALRYRAEYDTLTGVFNMGTFFARGTELLRSRQDRIHNLIRLDIDQFKVINDLHGLAEGDRLLKHIAALLQEKIAGRGICGRISGDIFCACVDFNHQELIRFTESLTRRLASYPLSGRVRPFFGICRADQPDIPINVLCDWANLALKTVKGSALKNYAFYDGNLRRRMLEEKKIESEMHSALSLGQFKLFLQPKVNIPSSRIVGAEGLARWQHPVEGLIPPAAFIPLFEKNGFILRLDEYIWEQACICLRSWIDRGYTPVPLSVNVSRMHTYDTRLCQRLEALVKKYGLSPHLLELELTESVFLDNESRLFAAMDELRGMGFHFSLDDFGAGYSSLNMLKTLPIQVMKIDRGFLSEVVGTDRGKTVIRHTIALAKDMDMTVIAEGVENVHQAAFLLEAGCTEAQGYFYARPMPVEEFEALAFTVGQPFPVAPEVANAVRAFGLDLRK